MTQLIKLLIILAATGVTLGAPVMKPRQLAGEGNFFDSVFTDTDNGVGYGVENAEDNLAELLGGTASRGSGSGGAGGNPPPPPPPKMVKRQGDKIANGAAADLNALGLTNEADFVKTDGGNIDGQLTDDATTLGAQFGGDEEDVLERAGNFVPNKVPAAGAAGH
ncbi:Ff.00g020830.m01.CDS01 [Fusarium sp. VM40]|nr:Ff.00g020830.m01.CDS01 [Fusarium sp. VM40]